MAAVEAVQAAQVFADEVKTFVSSLVLSLDSETESKREDQESQHAKVCGSLVSLAEAYAEKHETSCAKALEGSLRRTLCDILSRPPDHPASTSGAKRSKKGKGKGSKTTTTFAPTTVDEVWRQVSVLLDVTLHLFKEDQVAHGAFMFLLEDLAEEASLALCEKLFQYIETKQPSVLALSKNRLLLLKTCNKLLKRLSREDNPVLCGRLLILVTKLLPLSERSGVNLVGAFDVENTTDFQELEEGSKDDSGRIVDTALYNSLWKVQKLLSNPPTILEGKNFMEFQASTIKVLLAFDKTSASAKSEGQQDLSSNVYNFESLKYSTSPNLLSLQLHDATFKCEYLLQVLMVLNHLKIELPIKSTLHQTKADKLSRQKQVEDLCKLEAMVNKSLKKFIPGETFRLINTFIQRERHWILWKKVGTKVKTQVPVAAGAGAGGGKTKEVVKVNKCPPFERKSLPEDAEMFQEETQQNKQEKGPPMKRRRTAMPGFSTTKVKLGNEALDRLWNLTEDNYECLDFEDQEKVPRMDDLVQRVVDQAQPDSGVEEGDKLMSDMLYCWRVKRLLAQGSSKDFLKSCEGDLEELLPVVFPHLKDKIPEKEEKKEEEEEQKKTTEDDVQMNDAEEEGEDGKATTAPEVDQAGERKKEGAAAQEVQMKDAGESQKAEKE